VSDNVYSTTAGAETVGQAQILNSFSKPFELAGLFEAVDAGAFNEDAQMQEEVVMNDGRVENDSATHGSGMIVDDGMPASACSLSSSRKRARSPSLVTQVGTTDSLAQVRMPKRFRRAKDLSAYEGAAARSQSHELNRRMLKQDRKRAWGAASKMAKVRTTGQGMEIDELQETFISGVEG